MPRPATGKQMRSMLLLLALSPLNFVFSNTLSARSVTEETATKKCLYISSYHRGYEWSDGIEAGIRETLKGHCELRQIDMDTKRNKSPEFIFAATNKAIKAIEDWKPDIVLTSDDNAAKHIIAPHYKDDDIPFVFSGVNWTVQEYGFPYSNVTGIVEVSPYRSMLKETTVLAGNDGINARRALYIGAESFTEKKNFARIKEEAEALNIHIEPKLVPHFLHWKDALALSGAYDFVVIGSNAGIDAWDEQKAIEAAMSLTTRITVTSHEWMMPVSTLGFTTIPSEQGVWSATAAIQILQGVSPADIPLVTNKKWDFWANEQLLDLVDVKIRRSLMHRAKRVKPINDIEAASRSE